MDPCRAGLHRMVAVVLSRMGHCQADLVVLHPFFPQPSPGHYRDTCPQGHPPCHPPCHPKSRRGDHLFDPFQPCAATTRPHTWVDRTALIDRTTLIDRTATKDPGPVGSHTRLKVVGRWTRQEGLVRAGGSRLTHEDVCLCLRKTKRCSCSGTHEVRFTRSKGESGKRTYVGSYSDTQPGGNGRVSGFCGPDVVVVAGPGVAGGPRG